MYIVGLSPQICNTANNQSPPKNCHVMQRNENPENDYCEKLGVWGWEGKGVCV